MNAGGAPRRPRKIGRWILLAVVVVAVAVPVYRRRPSGSVPPKSMPADTARREDTAKVLFDSKGPDSVTIKPADSTARTPVVENPKEIITRVVPEGVRIRVEVLNGTDVSGLARRGMFAMRDAGFDVVTFGSTKERSDTTIVIDRTGHPDWAAMAVKTLSGPVVVKSEPDDSRYVDLSILLGRRWTAPRQPFHP